MAKNDPFSDASYLIQRKLFSFFGRSFYVYDSSGRVTLFTRQKPFKLREIIDLYDDEDMVNEILRIEARQIVDWHGTFDILDATTGESIVALRRRTIFWIIREQWDVLTADDEVIGEISDNRESLSFLGFFNSLFQRTLILSIGGREVAMFRRPFGFININLEVRFADDAQPIERVLGLAAGVIMATDVARRRKK